MAARVSIENVGLSINQPVCAALLRILLDGRFRTAVELATATGVPADSASHFLYELEARDVIECNRQGRHRYYRINRPDVVALIIAAVGNDASGIASLASESFGPRSPQLRHARTCYGHLAGSLGVQLLDSLLESGWLMESDQEYVVTIEGNRGLTAFGIDLPALQANKRSHFARMCIDWSERRPHLAGSLGRAITSRMIELGWIRQTPGQRALEMTPSGRQQLQQKFHFSIEKTDSRLRLDS